MSNAYTIGRASSNEADIQVGDAWSKHFHGQNDVALDQFRKLAEKFDGHVDALFGLGVSSAAAGQKDAAAAAFNKARSLCESELGKSSEDTDRFQMLMRMCEQHLARLQK